MQQRRIEELLLEREWNIVRAHGPARVVDLIARKGHFAVRGEQLAVLADLPASEIQLWIPETTDATVHLGDRYEVAPTLAPRSQTPYVCSVRALSPRIEELPQRLWRDFRIAEYGRAVFLSPARPLPLLQGERVRIDKAEPPKNSR